MENTVQQKPPLTSMERDFVNFFFVEVNGEKRTMSLMADLKCSKIRKKIVEDLDLNLTGEMMSLQFKLACGTMIYFTFEVVDEPLRADLVVGYDFVDFYRLTLDIENQQCVFPNDEVTISFSFAATEKDIPQTPIKTNVCVYSIGPINPELSKDATYEIGYPIGLHCSRLIKNELDRMLAKGLIRPSVSLWSSPLDLISEEYIPEVRFSIDYSIVNRTVQTHPFKIPPIHTRLMLLKGAKVFSLIHLKDPYDRIQLAESIRMKTAFATPFGHYEYNVLPETFKNSSVVMHLYLNRLFNDIDKSYCSIYKDSFLIWGKNVEEHIDRLEIVIDKLTENHFEVHPAKSQLLVTELRYFGHIMDANGCRIDPNIMQKLKNIPRPRSEIDLQSYLSSMAYYQSFLMSFLEVMPMAANSGKDKKNFFWSAGKESLYLDAHSQLNRHIVLIYPDFKRPFSLVSFAVELGVAGILTQVDHNYEKQRIVACFARPYTCKEVVASMETREIAAIVSNCEYFKEYLQNYNFLVYCIKPRIEYLLNNPRHKIRTEKLLRMMNLTEDRIRDRAAQPVHREKIAFTTV